MPTPFVITPTPPTTLELALGQVGTFSFTVSSLVGPDTTQEVVLQALLLGTDRKGTEVPWLVVGPQRTVNLTGGETVTVTITARPTSAVPVGEHRIKLFVADNANPNDTYADSAPVICKVVAGDAPVVKPPRRSFPTWLIPVIAGGVIVLGGGIFFAVKCTGGSPPPPDAPPADAPPPDAVVDAPPIDGPSFASGMLSFEEFVQTGSMSIAIPHTFANGVRLTRPTSGGTVTATNCNQNSGFFGFGCAQQKQFIPDGAVFIGMPNLGLNSTIIEFEFPADIVEFSAAITNSDGSAGHQYTLTGIDLNANVRASSTITTVAIVSWNANRGAIQAMAGFRKVTISGNGANAIVIDEVRWTVP
jgi:hypothetical protein